MLGALKDRTRDTNALTVQGRVGEAISVYQDAVRLDSQKSGAPPVQDARNRHPCRGDF